MRALRIPEMEWVTGGMQKGVGSSPNWWDDMWDWVDREWHSMFGGGSGGGHAPPSSSSVLGNGSGNGGMDPNLAQKLIGVVTITGATTDPATGVGAGDTADAAHKVQQYNQSTSAYICEHVDGGKWIPTANNGGGDCDYP